jgi:hypothetical protein
VLYENSWRIILPNDEGTHEAASHHHPVSKTAAGEKSRILSISLAVKTKCQVTYDLAFDGLAV